MRWRSVGYEWAAVAFLLGVLLVIQYYKPEWTGIVLGPTQTSNYQAIDGDSFKAGETEIRLHGIDAPEYRQTCRDTSAKQHPCGKMARDALSNLIRTRTVNCSIIERDRYGRHVSECRDGTIVINREMVRLGWAIAYRKHATAYIAAEREARNAKRGVWAWEFEMPDKYRERHRVTQGGLLAED
jgi:endonuclease YncB( thermonuclease family)